MLRTTVLSLLIWTSLGWGLFDSNPGWRYTAKSRLTGKTMTSCQATLTDWQNGYCYALTAAHCMESVIATVTIDALQPNSTLPAVKREEHGLGWLVMDFDLEISGVDILKTKAFVNERYFTEDGGDIAFLRWECSEAPTNLKAVPLCTELPEHGADVQYGKVRGASGIYTGEVQYYSNGFIDGHPATFHSSDNEFRVVQNGPETQHGDSGGPLIDSTRDCLLAPLTGSITSGELNGTALYGRLLKPHRLHKALEAIQAAVSSTLRDNL